MSSTYSSIPTIIFISIILSLSVFSNGAAIPERPVTNMADYERPHATSYRSSERMTIYLPPQDTLSNPRTFDLSKGPSMALSELSEPSYMVHASPSPDVMPDPFIPHSTPSPAAMPDIFYVAHSPSPQPMMDELFFANASPTPAAMPDELYLEG